MSLQCFYQLLQAGAATGVHISISARWCGMPRMSHCCQKQEGRREREGKGKKKRYNNIHPDSFVGVIELHAYQAGSAGSSKTLIFGMPIAYWHCRHPATGACTA